MTAELNGHSQVMGTVKFGQDRSLSYRAEVETAPAGKRFCSSTVRNFHSLFAYACLSLFSQPFLHQQQNPAETPPPKQPPRQNCACQNKTQVTFQQLWVFGMN